MPYSEVEAEALRNEKLQIENVGRGRLRYV